MLRNKHPDRDDNVGANSKKFIVWLDRLLGKERKEAISACVQLREKLALVIEPLESSEIKSRVSNRSHFPTVRAAASCLRPTSRRGSRCLHNVASLIKIGEHLFGDLSPTPVIMQRTGVLGPPLRQILIELELTFGQSFVEGELLRCLATIEAEFLCVDGAGCSS